MHDFFHSFHIGGARAGAGSGATRRVSSPARRRWHPDLDSGVVPDCDVEPVRADVAVDFVDMSAVVDRIHAAFFHNRR